MYEKVLTPLLSAIIHHITGTHKVLPVKTLHEYIDRILKRRSIFLESADKFGTPQYFYDERAFIDQIREFKLVFKRHFGQLRIYYAVKSNSYFDLGRKAVEYGTGLDVSSGMELSAALATNCRHIIFSGPGKTDEELKLAVTNRDRITIMLDSNSELNRLTALLKTDRSDNSPVRTGIRIRNPFQKTWNKFGIPLTDLGFMLRRITSEKSVKASGLQFHSSWNMGPERQAEMINTICGYISRQVPADYLKDFSFIDVGGGYWPERGEWLNPENTFTGRLFKMLFPSIHFNNRHYYVPAEKLNNFAREISRVLSLQPSPFPDLEVWTEPGRWISTPAMHIILKVIDVKDSGMVITDGGINLLGWERPLTEFIPVINLTRPSKKELDVSVFGSLCAPDDIWGRTVFGSGVETGDILLIPDQGAYTYSLRQEFIKPVAKVVKYDGKRLV